MKVTENDSWRNELAYPLGLSTTFIGLNCFVTNFEKMKNTKVGG